MDALRKLVASLACSLLSTSAATTITTNHLAYGANVGWISFAADTHHGAVIGEFVCSGYIYSANVGWIHLGDGTPANQIRYLNNSGSDYGVNHDGAGNLRGYAWAANIGWINFENLGAPRVDLASGRLNGFIYSANAGWIGLGNTIAHVQTDSIVSGADSDLDGIPDAWELSHTNALPWLGANMDSDGDGAHDLSEYFADTNPTDSADLLRITSITRGTPTPTYTTLQWLAKPTRFYAIEHTSLLSGGNWAELVAFGFPGAASAGFDDIGSHKYYRVRAFRPLAPQP